jgi:hypothetical protein
MNYAVGDMVYFWTGRGSHGYGIIQRITEDRIFIDPEPDATKGSDYRIRSTLRHAFGTRTSKREALAYVSALQSRAPGRALDF